MKNKQTPPEKPNKNIGSILLNLLIVVVVIVAYQWYWTHGGASFDIALLFVHGIFLLVIASVLNRVGGDLGIRIGKKKTESEKIKK